MELDTGVKTETAKVEQNMFSTENFPNKSFVEFQIQERKFSTNVYMGFLEGGKANRRSRKQSLLKEFLLELPRKISFWNCKSLFLRFPSCSSQEQLLPLGESQEETF